MRDRGVDQLPFICEIPIKDAYKIVTEKRVIGISIFKNYAENKKLNYKIKI